MKNLLNMQKLLFSLFVKVAKTLSGMGLRRIPGIYLIYKFIYRTVALKGMFLDVQGHKMFLDQKDSLELSVHGTHEPFATEFVKKEIKEGDMVLDIGGNIGYYTLILAKLVGDNGKVFAFEPDPDNYTLLEKNIRLNNYQNVTLVKKAVSNTTGKARLYLSKFTPEHKIYDSPDGHQYIEIESVRLDDYFKDYNGKIDFIKMDIEGAEEAALEGMGLLLQKNKSIKMITEFWIPDLKNFGTDPLKLLHKLRNYGFKIKLIDETNHRLRDIETIEIMTLCKKIKGINLLLEK